MLVRNSQCWSSQLQALALALEAKRAGTLSLLLALQQKENEVHQ